MVKSNLGAYRQLHRIAKIRADLELRRFSAFRANVEAERTRLGELEAALDAELAAGLVGDVAQMRLTAQRSAALLRQIAASKQEIERMRPAFEAARKKAAAEYGRQEVIASLEQDLRTDISYKRQLAQERAQETLSIMTPGCDQGD